VSLYKHPLTAHWPINTLCLLSDSRPNTTSLNASATSNDSVTAFHLSVLLPVLLSLCKTSFISSRDELVPLFYFCVRRQAIFLDPLITRSSQLDWPWLVLQFAQRKWVIIVTPPLDFKGVYIDKCTSGSDWWFLWRSIVCATRHVKENYGFCGEYH